MNNPAASHERFDPIAIVGAGCVFAGANNPEELWKLVHSGRDASSEVQPQRWVLHPSKAQGKTPAQPDHVHTTRGFFARIPEPDPKKYCLPKDILAKLDPGCLLALEAASQALGTKLGSINPKRAGVILGHIALPTVGTCKLALQTLGRTLAQKAGMPVPPECDGIEPSWLARPATLPALMISQAYDLGGPSFTLDAACASSFYALKLAADALHARKVDVMLAGGVSAPDSLYTSMGFSQLRALSPTGMSRPFDHRADGLMVGEGAGIFLLKRLSDAVRNGDEILGVIRGIGLSNDIGGGLLAPNSEGQLRAMRSAYAQAKWKPSDIQLVECHATGTPLGDAVEFSSLRELWAGYQTREEACVIGSVKSNVGHVLTGAGGAGLIKVLWGFRNQTLPPTANFEHPSEGVHLNDSPFTVLKNSKPWHSVGSEPRKAALSGFGFGGINAHVLVEEWNGQPISERTCDPEPVSLAIVGLSARIGNDRNTSEFFSNASGLSTRKAGPIANWNEIWGSEWFRSYGFQQPDSFCVDDVLLPADGFRIPPKELAQMLPQQALALDTSREALEGLSWREGVQVRTGVYLGAGLDLNTTNFHVRWWWRNLRGPENSQGAGSELNADKTMGALASIAASRIAREYRFGGPSFTISADENSGLWALDTAWHALQNHSIDVALVGAVDLCSDPRIILPFLNEGKLGVSDGDMKHQLADGAVMLVVKRHEDAVRDGDRILSVLSSLGYCRKNPNPEDEGKACTEAMMDAFASSSILPASIEYLSCSDADLPGHQLGAWKAIEDLIDPRHQPQGVVYHHHGVQNGWAGASTGLLSFATTVLALSTKRFPGNSDSRKIQGGPSCLSHLIQPSFWINNSGHEKNSAGLITMSSSGAWFHGLLQEHKPTNTSEPLCFESSLPEVLFVLEANSKEELAGLLNKFQELNAKSGSVDIHSMAKTWLQFHPRNLDASLAMVLVVQQRHSWEELCQAARKFLQEGHLEKAWSERIFFAREPLATTGSVAFVYPGSGADFVGMGREYAVYFPEILARQENESISLRAQWSPEYYWLNNSDKQPLPHQKIMAQVSYGCLATGLLASIDLKPDVSIGYSLGESSALIANHAWFDRDGLWRMLETSSLFRLDLVGPRRAISCSWELPAGVVPDWIVGLVERSEQEIRQVLEAFDKVYLLIINSARESVIGGDSNQVRAVVAKLGCRLIPLSSDTAAVHCEAARPIADAYRKFHTLPTQVPENLLVYSAAFGGPYEVTKVAAAEAITGLAVDTMDFKAVVEAAYQDGARIFVEVGPGASCSRIIGNILADKNHLARSISTNRGSELSAFLRTIACLISHRVRLKTDRLLDGTKVSTISQHHVLVERAIPDFQVAVLSLPEQSAVHPDVPCFSESNLEPAMASSQLEENSKILGQAVEMQQAELATHEEYLRLARQTLDQMNSIVAFQTQLLAASNNLVEWETEQPLHDFQDNIPQPVEWFPLEVPRSLNREQCLEFARGKIGKVLGKFFAEVDQNPTRVRLPDEPLMLVDRILDIQGEPGSMGSGRVITEHDVLPDAWYLDQGRIPTCIAVESGQADLFLSGFLGIDKKTDGNAVYRLLDAQVTFFGSLPKAGDTIHYDIRIDRFFRHNDTYLFRFWYDATVNGKPLMAMREGCAGFFSDEELARGKGVIFNDPGILDGKTTPDWRPLVSMNKESFSDTQLDNLRSGDLAGCFGSLFEGLPIRNPAALPGGKMRLVHRIPLLEPEGGPWRLGRILGEADIHPDDWFLTCHFIDDQVMPGTLMYECCLHTLRVLLYRSGWVGESSEVAFEPVPGVTGQLRCRGQVTAKTKKVTYEVMIKERGYRPEPYVVVDAYMHADGKNVVEINSMSLRMTGWSKESVERIWGLHNITSNTALFDNDRILAFAIGKPSEAFGDPYKVFDSERKIARLPGPPYKFLDRITEIRCEPWKMVAGGEIVAQYDIPSDEWYFKSERQNSMPFAVLLEVALQPCGWLAAYIGSALTSPVDLSFRNLGGKAILKRLVTPGDKMLEVHVKITKVSSSAGMVVQEYLFDVFSEGQSIYKGETTFGFFTKEALANQIGVRGASLQDVSHLNRKSQPIPTDPPFPDSFLRMLDLVEYLETKGGSKGLGYIRGTKQVDPSDWFFKAHFYQDPVTPGSLGLEAMVQLMKVFATTIWPEATDFSPMIGEVPHIWLYRGQVIPHNKIVVVEVDITRRDDDTGLLVANGKLAVDGIIIYEMRDFRLKVNRRGT